MTSSGTSSAFDPLSDVLRVVRLSAAVFFHVHASRSFRSAMPDGTSLARHFFPRSQRVISYHVIRRGRCYADVPGGPEVALEAGDVLVLPRGDSYRIAVDRSAFPDAKEEESVALLRGVRSGAVPFDVSDGGPEEITIVCGFLGCDFEPFNPLLAALPRLLVVRGSARGPEDRLDRLLDLTLSEPKDAVPGNDAVRMRLSELIFVEVIRRHLSTLPDKSGWLAALGHPVAGRALALLHERPAEPWTLPALAEAAGASRTALADHFTRLVGDPPIQYLTKWRMQVAACLLGEGELKVSAVASRVGYDSEAAFSRAFKKIVGVPPAAFRERSVYARQ
ncbi:MAG TPA: AraC family transcriptional regulator [Polyangiaceae bacterium]|nr:AraC family transcriptional regulator [Polyangiaceae bacterium]